MADKPNILVIWGDDIGITNLSCYSDGLMGYRTPNIDRIADEGMRFTDSYGEQSCTAGRSSFITGQSVFRTGLSKVGMPGVDVGLQAEDADDRRAAQAARATRPGSSARTTSATSTSTCRRSTASTSSSATSTTSTPRRSPSRPNYPPAEDFPRFNERFRPRGVLHSLGHRRGRHDRATPRFGPRRQAADRGHRPADEEAHGDDRRRGRSRHAIDFIERQARRRARRSSCGSTRRTCTSAPTQAGEPRAGGALAVALPRHDDRPRQGRRRAARQARRARPGRRTRSSSTAPTTGRT